MSAASGTTSSRKQLVLVTGAGRSGTSAMAGVFARLGFLVPLPVLEANSSNPYGFYESWWPVKFHNRLFKRAAVERTDGQPGAARLIDDAVDAKARSSLQAWLSEQFEASDLVLVKDPRAAFVATLWSDTARDLGASIGYVVMLRHPSEVLGSRSTYYAARRPGLTSRQFDIRNLCGWINQNLTLERQTRGQARIHLRYADLLADWRVSVDHVLEALTLSSSLLSPTAEAEIDAFIEPSLRRHEKDWGGRELPPALVELAERTWAALEACSPTSGADTTGTEAELDEIFADYQQYYSDAEAVAHDYAATRSRRALKAGRRQGREQAAEAFAERRLRNRIRRKARSVFSVVRRTPAKSSD